MNLKNKIFFFDVNHTLINTAMGHLHAMSSMEKTLIQVKVKKDMASKIIKHVHYITSLMIAGFLIVDEDEWSHVPGGKEAYNEIISKIYRHQKLVNSRWGFVKKWSREVFLKIAADSVGISLDSKSISRVADAHWLSITQKAKPFASAKILFKELKKLNIPAYILTSSDGRLIFKDRTFFYDPDYSEKSKKKRMEQLRKEGLHFNDIVVGDPQDKPSKDFFRKGLSVVSKNLGRHIEAKDIVMVGNSFEDDLEVPINELGFGLGILVGSIYEPADKNKKIIRINDLQEIIRLL